MNNSELADFIAMSWVIVCWFILTPLFWVFVYKKADRYAQRQIDKYEKK